MTRDYDADAIAEQFGVAEKTVRQWVGVGLPHDRVGARKKIMLNPSEVEQFLDHTGRSGEPGRPEDHRRADDVRGGDVFKIEAGQLARMLPCLPVLKLTTAEALDLCERYAAAVEYLLAIQAWGDGIIHPMPASWWWARLDEAIKDLDRMRGFFNAVILVLSRGLDQTRGRDGWLALIDDESAREDMRTFLARCDADDEADEAGRTK